MSALVVRVDAQVETDPRDRTRGVLVDKMGGRVGGAREVSPVGGERHLVWARELVTKVQAHARALGRAGHEESRSVGGEDGGGGGVAGRGEGQEVRVARGGGEEAAAEGAGHEV
jgi:hypothetical protein